MPSDIDREATGFVARNLVPLTLGVLAGGIAGFLVGLLF